MMQMLRLDTKGGRLVVLAVVALVVCPGCALGDALLDGVFLGVSETVSALLVSAAGG